MNIHWDFLSDVLLLLIWIGAICLVFLVGDLFMRLFRIAYDYFHA